MGTSNMSKTFYNGSVFLSIGISVIILFYYAYLMPLHIDEAGWWFNYTSTSWKNRFNELDPVAQFNGPFHTLSTYLAKLTLPFFGQNGIGWRLPVIIFGLLDCGIIYFFIKTVTGSEKTARLGAVFVLLNPFLNHYSHESRSYVILFFFSTCAYLCIFHLFRNPGKKRDWFLLVIIFLLSYTATLSAIVFLFIFMASLWILKISNYYMPLKKHTE
ncbi:MAG TPA: phospholipid carrier-dependent glycosyltransferase, partial [Nitrospinaceae bacterium]|nr:phospholipid carrier-dependent glycosyltransferase [Nitrospinaceae bacterium]